MTNVTIHCCTLRIVRRGGWSWGASLRTLANDVVRRLPELIARQLAGLFADDEDVEVRSPLRIRVPIAMHDLLAVVRPDGPQVDGSRARALLEARVASALEQALTDATVFARPVAGNVIGDAPNEHGGSESSDRSARSAQSDEDRTIASDESSRLPGVTPSAMTPRAAAEVLLAWHVQGDLAARLVSFNLSALRAWHDRVLAPSQSHRIPTTDMPVERERFDRARDSYLQVVRDVLGPVDLSHAPLIARLRARLVAAVEVTKQCRCRLDDTALRAALDEVVPIDDDPMSFESDAPQVNRAVHREAAGYQHSSIIAKPSLIAREKRLTSQPLMGDVLVECALPFLVAGSLARLGWLEAMAGVMNAVRSDELWPALATALAYKTLGSVERGRMRTFGDLRDAAVFAGVTERIPDELIVRLSRQLTSQLSPADGTIAHAVMEGRVADRPLLFTQLDRDVHTYMIVDVNGVFPVVWMEQQSGTLRAIGQSDTTLLLVDRATASAELLQSLDRAGRRFLAEGSLARGEPWRVVRDRAGATWITNDGASRSSKLVAASRALPEAFDATQRVYEELARKRPSAPPLADPDFERSLTVAVAVALGDIAWRLWHEREPTEPVLALERFGDLGARVRFGPDEVHVVLPLGKRSSDLGAHGFLRNVHAVPWLNNRRLTFARG